MQSEADFVSQKFSVYVLGAGFSRPAGLPLAPELWTEVRNRGLSLSGRAGQFREDLEYFVEYKGRCGETDLTFDQVNFEEFMAFLDVEFYLGLRGKDTWSSQGNESQVVVKTLIGEILTERMPGAVPDLYLEFVRLLKPDDYVLTFNYDTLLERALESAGIPFRLYPERLKPNPYGGRNMLIDDSRKEVVVLKLHGSIDWFDRTDYAHLEKQRIEQGSSYATTDLVFGSPQRFGAIPLLEGPRFPDDPLRQMYRVTDIKNLYRSRSLFLATPSLLNPSSMKILYSRMFREFWWGLGAVGEMNFRMVIIGFSLPSQDEYARQVLYRLIRNYQNMSWDKAGDGFGHKKAPLVLIDYRPSVEKEEELRRSYAFVDWNKAVTCFTGFDDAAISLIKAN